jgi:hypothetical protein
MTYVLILDIDSNFRGVVLITQHNNANANAIPEAPNKLMLCTNKLNNIKPVILFMLNLVF